MKKFSAILLALITVFTMSMTAFAAGGFVSSPSGNQVPVVDSSSNENANFEFEIVVTPYADRADLDAEGKAEIEAAYNAISGASDLTALSTGLKTLAENKGIDAGKLAASDLFDVDYTTSSTETPGKFTVKLSAETLGKFVALMHYENGAWNVVENATVSGNTLTFSVDSFSPFAIIVETDGSVATGDLNNILPWALAVCASGVLLVAVLVVVKKQSAK